MKEPEFPKEVTKGSITVTIYEREFTRPDKEGKQREYLEYILAYYEQGKRRRETSADYLAIKSRADEVLDDLSEGRQTSAGTLKSFERNDYIRAVESLAPTKIPLDVAAAHFAEAVRILGSDLVIVAAREYVARNLTKIQPKLISEAAEEFIGIQELRESAGKLSAVHVGRQASRLRAFAGSLLMDTASVTATDLDRFLDGLKKPDGKPVSPRTRGNWANEITAFYEWAKVKRYVPGDFDEHTRITRLDSDQDGTIEIYTPKEMAALLACAESELVPFVVIGAFAGLRSSEILRLDWSHVRPENGDPCIVVEKGKVKKRGKSRRIVPMVDNLKVWLNSHLKKSGPVWPHSEPALYDRLQILASTAQAKLRKSNPRANLSWKANALRHSFISYRVASIKKVDQVALEAGNSPQIIFSNYRELVIEADAVKWFSILPH